MHTRQHSFLAFRPKHTQCLLRTFLVTVYSVPDERALDKVPLVPQVESCCGWESDLLRPHIPVAVLQSHRRRGPLRPCCCAGGSFGVWILPPIGYSTYSSVCCTHVLSSAALPSSVYYQYVDSPPNQAHRSHRGRILATCWQVLPTAPGWSLSLIRLGYDCHGHSPIVFCLLQG